LQSRALLLVKHCAHDVELFAGIRRLTAFVPDLGLLLGVCDASLLRTFVASACACAVAA
jgi:hypothetical protein